MSDFMDPAADLSVRETILGMMKTRDVLGVGKIHTSDFRAMANDLGYPLGHQVIENILVHCVINSEGLIDFTGVERELARERRLMSTNVNKSDHMRQLTSFSTPAHPWRADVVHKQKMQSERQGRLLQEFQANVSSEFQLFAAGKRSEEAFVQYIQSLGIVPTKSFLELLRKNRSTDIQYSEFMRSLINYDPSNRMIDTSQPAGGAPNLMVSDRNGQREEITAGLFYSRKRMDVKKKTEMRIGSDDPMRSGKRLVQNVSTNEAAVKAGGMHQFFKNSQQVRSLIVDQNEPINMLSTAQIDMRRGQLGKGSNAEKIAYSSEQRILREQVLAALRKLDAGELSSVEFQDKMFTMGVELPDAVLRELQQYVQSGLLNWSACVQALDDYVFKHKSIMEVDAGADEEANEYRAQMIAAIKARGPSGFTQLASVFRELDEDGSGDLSYGEFLKGCQRFRLQGMSNEKFRVLFNSFDKSGDGLLSFDEFIRALRGELSRKRKAILFNAFRKLDRNGLHEISIETFLDGYSPGSHPDVVSERKTEEMVLTSIIEAFRIKSNEDTLSETQFTDYFSNLSAYYDSDEEFVDMVCRAFQIDRDTKPPPPSYRLGKGADRDSTPVGKQVHGDYITWRQEPSAIEARDTSKAHKKKVIDHLVSGDVTGNLFKSSKNDEIAPEIEGISIRRTTGQSRGTQSLLAWDTKRKTGAPERQLSPQPGADTVKDQGSGGAQEEAGRFVIKGYHWSDQKKKQYAGTCPYGVSEPYERYDPVAEQKRKDTIGAPKSLGSFVKK